MFGSENIGRRGSKGSINVDFQGFFQLHFFARTIFGHLRHGIGVGGLDFQSIPMVMPIGVTVSHCRLVQTDFFKIHLGFQAVAIDIVVVLTFFTLLLGFIQVHRVILHHGRLPTHVAKTLAVDGILLTKG